MSPFEFQEEDSFVSTKERRIPLYTAEYVKKVGSAYALSSAVCQHEHKFKELQKAYVEYSEEMKENSQNPDKEYQDRCDCLVEIVNECQEVIFGVISLGWFPGEEPCSELHYKGNGMNPIPLGILEAIYKNNLNPIRMIP